MTQFLKFVTVLSSLFPFALSHSIADFGAIPSSESNEACYANSRAIESAFFKANSTLDESERVVVVPFGARYCIFMTDVRSQHNVTFVIDGELFISRNQTEWRKVIVDFTAALNFEECRGITLRGQGGIDGQGYGWWWNTILRPDDNDRPHMIWMYGNENVIVRDLYFYDSPNFHLRIYDVQHLFIENVTIHVNITAQREVLQAFEHWDYSFSGTGGVEGNILGGLPTFPLNTDGIDVNGNDILIQNCTIQNFDDAVVVKPNDNTSYWGVCAENVFVRDIDVTFGVGMSIGSMGPSETKPCIRNVTFDNIRFKYPLKGIYVKTNPGTVGQGSITDITFSNMVMDNSLWYPIWIGPQQMHQPGEESMGCSFVYPIIDDCPTQPLITIKNVLLVNITATNTLFLPGVILGDLTNPFQNVSFINVLNSGKNLVQSDYVCQGVTGGSSENSSPKPACL